MLWTITIAILQAVAPGPPSSVPQLPVNVAVVDRLSEPDAVAVIVIRQGGTDFIVVPTTVSAQHLRRAILAYRGLQGHGRVMLNGRTRIPVYSADGSAMPVHNPADSKLLRRLRSRPARAVAGIGTSRVQTIWVTLPS